MTSANIRTINNSFSLVKNILKGGYLGKCHRKLFSAKGAVKKAGLKSGSLKEPIQDKGVC